MTPATQTLAEWLLVQIGATEARASIHDGEFTAHVLAECEAHRRIVGLHADDSPSCPSCAEDGEYDRVAVDYPCPTLRALAAIYADRDGFREEWAL